MSRLTPLIVAICALSAAAFHAQEKQHSGDNSPQQTLRVDVNLVTVGVYVTDRKNRVISGLTAADFSIYEDDKVQNSSFFSAAEQPISLALLVDRNDRMGTTGKFDEAKKAVLALVDGSHPDTEITYLPYDHEAVPMVGPLTDRARIKTAIATSKSERAGTSLYDPIIQALGHLEKANLPRQVLVVISERADQHSRHNLEELIQAVQGSLAQIYLIGYFDSEEDQVYQSSGKTVRLLTGKEVDNPRYVFRRLAEESGAECFFVSSSADLSQAVETISQELKQQYTLAYHSSKKDNSYHRIQVGVKGKGLKVRARHGFRILESQEGSPVSVAGPVTRRDLSGSTQPDENRYQSKLEWKGGKVIYREDFADSASGWPHSRASFYRDGEYHLVEADARAANGPWLKDFDASITLELRDGSEYWPVARRKVVAVSPEAGLVFRLNEAGYYALLISDFSLVGHKEYRLIKQQVKPKKTIELLPRAACPEQPLPSPSSRYRLGVRCQGNSLKLYINEQPVGSFLDESFSGGITGMILTEKGHAAFDDLVVEEIR
jgi:Ca-activated chloride channel family protein